MRFSVIIPTYQRGHIVTRTVGAFERQIFRDFEVVVVVDGSTDGTAAALRDLDPSFPLTVLEQPNKGRAAACNTAARIARGELLLILDDDMEADPSMLLEHDHSQRKGADLVLGDLPLHPDSPATLLSWGVGTWASERSDRLSTPGATIGLGDLLTGQVSISRELFEQLGGFDESFTREGMFGGEDMDFGYRVLKSGFRIAFNPKAISFQYYDVDPSAYLGRAREAGRSFEELIAKHPEHAVRRADQPRFRTRRSRILLGPLVIAPPIVSWPLRAGSATLVRRGVQGTWLRRLFWGARTLENQRGARAARRALWTGSAIVLAYHAIADLSDDRILAQYGIPRIRFAAQLDDLRKRGWTFVDLDTVLRALNGEARLPRRAVLLTFDDASVDLQTAAAPVLAERAIPAVAFAVAGHIGGSNEWDRSIGAAALELLDAEGLRAVAEEGIEIGSHGVSHRMLPRITGQELTQELAGSADILEAAGLPRPRVFAYPHGEWTAEVADAAREAGYEAAFTVTAGVLHRGAVRHALPRIEVMASDTLSTLRLKIATANWSARNRRRLFKLLRIR